MSLGGTERNPSSFWVSGVEDGCRYQTKPAREHHGPVCSINDSEAGNRHHWNDVVRARKWPTSLYLDVLGKKNKTKTSGIIRICIITAITCRKFKAFIFLSE